MMKRKPAMPGSLARDIVIAAGIGSIASVLTALVFLRAWDKFSVEHLITIAGWIVAAAVTAVGWTINQRAQRRLFIHNIKNEARKELVAAIRVHQDFLIAVMRELFAASIHANSQSKARRWTVNQWEGWRDHFEEVLRRDSKDWVLLLEQYEVVFPETRRCRLDLVRSEIELTKDLWLWLSKETATPNASIAQNQRELVH
jgi:hypothetical protein